jgi:hypothetical protein
MPQARALNFGFVIELITPTANVCLARREQQSEPAHERQRRAIENPKSDPRPVPAIGFTRISLSGLGVWVDADRRDGGRAHHGRELRGLAARRTERATCRRIRGRQEDACGTFPVSTRNVPIFSPSSK